MPESKDSWTKRHPVAFAAIIAAGVLLLATVAYNYTWGEADADAATTVPLGETGG